MKTTLSVIEITAILVFAYSGMTHARKSGFDYIGVLALEMKTPILPAAFIGVITATFGGVLRDVLSNQKPQLFQPSEPLYATCAFAGAWVYIAMLRLDILPTLALIVCIAVTFLLRTLAIIFNLRLPF